MAKKKSDEDVTPLHPVSVEDSAEDIRLELAPKETVESLHAEFGAKAVKSLRGRKLTVAQVRKELSK